MHVTVDTKALKGALASAKRVAVKKPRLAILAGVQLAASDNQLAVTMTDIDSMITLRIPADVAESGVQVLDLAEAIQAVDATGAARISVNGKLAERTVSSFDAADYPDVPRVHPMHETASQRLTIPDLRGQLLRVIYAASTDATRPHLCSVNWNAGAGALWLVTTDGHRLAATRTATTVDAMDAWSYCIGATAAEQLAKLLPKGATVDVTFHGEQFIDNYGTIERKPQWLRCAWATPEGAATFETRVLDTIAPPWEQVVPASPSLSIGVSRKAFLAACQAVVKSIGRDAIKGAALDFAKRTITPHAGPHAGQTDWAVPFEAPVPEGCALIIGFNLTYLVEPLAALDDASVTFALDGALDPLRLATDKGDFIYVVMPMRV